MCHSPYRYGTASTHPSILLLPPSPEPQALLLRCRTLPCATVLRLFTSPKGSSPWSSCTVEEPAQRSAQTKIVVGHSSGDPRPSDPATQPATQPSKPQSDSQWSPTRSFAAGAACVCVRAQNKHYLTFATITGPVSGVLCHCSLSNCRPPSLPPRFAKESTRDCTVIDAVPDGHVPSDTRCFILFTRHPTSDIRHPTPDTSTWNAERRGE